MKKQEQNKNKKLKYNKDLFFIVFHPSNMRYSRYSKNSKNSDKCIYTAVLVVILVGLFICLCLLVA